MTLPNDWSDEYGTWRNAFGSDGADTAAGVAKVDPLDEVADAPFTFEDVEEVFGCNEGENDGPPAVCVGRLKDGRFFALEAWRDYTGWG